MKEKKKLLYTLASLLIVLSLVIPVWSTVVRADTPTEIWDWHGLNAIRDNLGGDYTLMNDLHSTTAGYDALAGPDAHDGKGWEPIVFLGDSFTGSFNGQGYEIKDLFIDRDDEDGVGLFGAVDDGGVIQNVGVVSVNVTGLNGVGGLVGDNWGGTVSNCYSSASVTGNYSVGGLVGWNVGTVSNCYSSASVTGNDAVGGLVGSSDGVVDYSYSNAIVTGDSFVGGLVGDNYEGLVSNAYSGSTVTGRSDVGGLVGINDGIVSNCYATGDVIGEEYVGGLIGSNRLVSVTDAASGGSIAGNHDSGGQARGRSITIVNSYSDAITRGDSDLGGLMGGNGGAVSNCYATGSVHGNDYLGGLVGFNGGTVSNSFWDMDTSGMEGSDGGTGKTTVEMQDFATFTDTATEGLDDPWHMIDVEFGTTNPDHTWNIVDGQTYPFLSWQTPVDAEVPGALILGQTREVNCAILTGVTIAASLNGDEVDTTSGGDGNYSLSVPVTGEYRLVASKDGFRPQTRWIDVEDLEHQYELHFRGNDGLVPDQANLSYVLDCIDLWLYPPGEECGLTLFRVLDVIDAWLYPIIESE